MQPVAAGVHPEHATALRFTLERLPAELAEVAVYYHLHERTHDDIAHLLGCSRRHVGDLIKRLDRWMQRQEELGAPQPRAGRRSGTSRIGARARA